MLGVVVGVMMQAALPHAVDAGWEGEKTCTLLEDNAHLRAFKCVFEAGQGHEPHFHEPHFGYILEGGRMQILSAENKTREVETAAGGTWWSGSPFEHSALNIDDQRTSYLIVEPKSIAATAPSSFEQALDVHISTIAARDVDAYADTITGGDDLNIIFPDGRRSDTTQNAIDFHEDWFDDDEWRLSFDIVKIKEGAELAFALAKTQYTANKGAIDNAGNSAAWHMMVFAREDGKWKLIHGQVTPIADGEQ